MSFDDVKGMFHEFGHGLHGLLSNCKYPLPGRHQRAARLRRVPSQFNRCGPRASVLPTSPATTNRRADPKPLLDKVSRP